MHQHIAPVKISLLSHLATQSWCFDRQCTARALCCSWMCIINTVRANSAESPIISRGKLYVNAPLMASFVNGIVVQARGIEPCRERNSIRSSMPRAARESSFNNLAVIVSCIAFSSPRYTYATRARELLRKIPANIFKADITISRERRCKTRAFERPLSRAIIQSLCSAGVRTEKTIFPPPSP